MSCCLIISIIPLLHTFCITLHYNFYRFLALISSLSRVINAGKSTLNEDQACCEVLVVKRRPAGTSTPNRTPMTRRRSSLPNGEGLGLRENLVSHANGPGSIMKYLITILNGILQIYVVIIMKKTMLTLSVDLK